MKSLPSPKKVVQGIARATSFRRKTLQQQPKTLPTTDPTTESPAINDQEEAHMASPRAKSLPSPMQVAQGIARVTSFKRKTLQQQKVPTTATPTDESPTSEVSIEDIDDHEEARREEALLASLRNAREHNQLCAEPEDTLRSSAPMQLLTAGPDPGPFASPALEPPQESTVPRRALSATATASAAATAVESAGVASTTTVCCEKSSSSSSSSSSTRA
jgi:hypothetical protein